MSRYNLKETERKLVWCYLQLLIPFYLSYYCILTENKAAQMMFIFFIGVNKHFRSDICQRLSSICCYRIVPPSQDVCENMHSLLALVDRHKP